MLNNLQLYRKMYCEQQRSLEVCCVFLNLERHNFLVTDKALHQRVGSKKCGIYLNFALFSFSDTLLPLSGSKIRTVLNIFDGFFSRWQFSGIAKNSTCLAHRNHTLQTKSWMFMQPQKISENLERRLYMCFSSPAVVNKNIFLCMHVCALQINRKDSLSITPFSTSPENRMGEILGASFYPL